MLLIEFDNQYIADWYYVECILTIRSIFALFSAEWYKKSYVKGIFLDQPPHRSNENRPDCTLERGKKRLVLC
jgi:hypothetical protein